MNIRFIFSNIIRLIIILFLCIGFSISIQAQQVFSGLPITTYYSPDIYEAGTNNWDIIQDSDGMILVANDKGVLEFDGFDWTLYQVKNKTKVRHMALSNNRLYVGAQGEFGYFERQKNGEFYYTSLSEQFIGSDNNFGEVWRVFFTNDNIYFSTIEFIFIYHIKTNSLSKISTTSFLGISFFVNNNIYALDWEVGLVKLEEDRLKPLNGGGFLKENTIFGILPMDHQRLLIATGTNGVFIYNGKTFTPWNTPYNEVLKNSVINTAVRLSDGNFAFGTLNAGLFILNPSGEHVLHLNETGTTTNITIHSLFQDTFGNIWAGTNDGVLYLETNSPFTVFDKRWGVIGAGYAGIIHNNQLILGTDNGAFSLNPNNGLKEQKAQPIKNTAGNVYTFDYLGSELLMGHNDGAFKIKKNEANPINTTHGIWNFKLSNDSQTRLLSGTYRGLVPYTYQNSQWTSGEPIPGFSESSRYLERDRNENWWISHGYRGVFRLKLNSTMDSIEAVHFYDEEKGFPSSIQITMHKINNQLVYAAETGIYTYNEAQDYFEKSHPFNTLFGKLHIRELEEDALGNIYYISEDGPGIIKLNEVNKYEVHSYPFRRIAKKLNEDTDKIIVLNSQNILFCSNHGFIHYNPLKITTNNQKPSIVLKEIELSNGLESNTYSLNRSTSIDSVFTVPYKFNNAHFSYVSPSFSYPKAEYRIRLLGYDKNWSEWSTDRQKEYTNLFEGKYTFQVMAKDEQGLESEIIEFRFKIQPPWFRSNFAYFLYALMTITFILLIIYSQRFRYKKERIKLVNEQSKRLEEKESIITTVKNDKLKAEINHKNKELATSTMHLLSKNEFMMKMKGSLHNMLTITKNDEIKKDLSRIVKDIDFNLKDDKAWENFEIHFDEVHGNFSKRIKEAHPQLTPKEIKMCVYLRLNMSTKEIANLMNISVRGVEISRYRIRKKLELERDVNLTEMIMDF